MGGKRKGLSLSLSLDRWVKKGKPSEENTVSKTGCDSTTQGDVLSANNKTNQEEHPSTVAKVTLKESSTCHDDAMAEDESKTQKEIHHNAVSKLIDMLTVSPGNTGEAEEEPNVVSQLLSASATVDVGNQRNLSGNGTPKKSAGTNSKVFITEEEPSVSALSIPKYQPVNTVPPKKLKSRTLHFQPSWYQKYDWLHFDVNLQKVLCHTCVTAKNLRLHSDGIIHEKAFTSVGFNNWKDANQSFQQHQQSQFHKTSVFLLTARQEASISEEIKRANERSQSEALKYLKIIVTSIMFLGQQGLALRGDEHDGGNLISLLKLRGEDTPGLLSWLHRSKSFTSGEIQNEILGIISNSILRNIMKKIHAAKYYSLIVDETTDASTTEQVSVNVRIVNENYEPEEYFLGLYETSSTTASTLHKLISDVLIRFGLKICDLRGQCYDGAANMSGRFKGVRTLFSRQEPRALFVHCFNHSLNLALQDACKDISFVRDILSISNEIGTIIKASPKRMAQFNQVCEDADTRSVRPKPLCQTRWSVRVNSVDSILRSYNVLLAVLEELAHSNDNVASKAQGLQLQMERGDCYLGLLMAKDVFTPCERLSKLLQKEAATVGGSIEAAAITVGDLESRKKTKHFKSLWKEMEDKTKEFDLKMPTLPRQRRIPKRFRNYDVPREFESAEEKFQSIYFSLIEVLCDEISARFAQEDLGVLAKCELLLTKFPEGHQKDLQDKFMDLCKFYDWKYENLESQLRVLKNVENFKWNSIDEFATSFRNLKPETRDLFPDVGTFIKTLLVVPCSSAGAERSFSRLRRIKTYLRTTMGQARLNHCCVINCYPNELQNLDVQSMMNDFISKGNRDKIFGKC